MNRYKIVIQIHAFVSLYCVTSEDRANVSSGVEWSETIIKRKKRKDFFCALTSERISSDKGQDETKSNPRKQTMGVKRNFVVSSIKIPSSMFESIIAVNQTRERDNESTSRYQQSQSQQSKVQPETLIQSRCEMKSRRAIVFRFHFSAVDKMCINILQLSFTYHFVDESCFRSFTSRSWSGGWHKRSHNLSGRCIIVDLRALLVCAGDLWAKEAGTWS